MENTTGSQSHVVLLASIGMGHLIPILELGKRLSTHHNLDVTIFVVASQSSAAESQILQSAMTENLCEIVELPPVNISGLVSPDAAVFTQICAIMRANKPALRSAISGLSFRPAALIVDLFGSEAMMVVQGEYVDQKEPLKIPGCKAVRPEDVIDPMVDRTNQQYLEYVRMGMDIPKCDGILLNIWEDLQPKTLEALRDEELLELGVAVRPNILASEGVVGRKEIEMMIRTITVDKEATYIRNRVKKLKYSAVKTLSEGGSSYNALSLVAKKLELQWKTMEVNAS
ncbi:hypothetical protein OIU78_028872 [Salix suchowensis]|nr:hypothetical protein OIU78_028872 [Salix suchowensis]